MKRFDLVVLLIAAVVFVVALAPNVDVFAKSTTGDAVAVVYYRNEPVATLDLRADRDFVFERDGAYNQVRVQDGAVLIVAANCPNQNCVHMGARNRTGDRLVCLPNRLVVKIENGAAPLTDAVSG